MNELKGGSDWFCGGTGGTCNNNTCGVTPKITDLCPTPGGGDDTCYHTCNTNSVYRCWETYAVC